MERIRRPPRGSSLTPERLRGRAPALPRADGRSRAGRISTGLEPRRNAHDLRRRQRDHHGPGPAPRRRPAAIGHRHRARCDRHDRPDRPHRQLQPGRGTDVRLHRRRGDRPERQPADARPLPSRARRLPRTLPRHRRAADHRHRPDRHRRPQEWPHLPDRARRRRGQDRRHPGLHRLHPRHLRARRRRGTRPHPPGRAQPRRAPVGDGRDRLDHRPRAQPAADRDRQLRRGRATTRRGGRYLRPRRRPTSRRPSPRRTAPAR